MNTDKNGVGFIKIYIITDKSLTILMKKMTLIVHVVDRDAYVASFQFIFDFIMQYSNNIMHGSKGAERGSEPPPQPHTKENSEWL